MTTVDKLLSGAETIESLNPTYRLGGSGDDGTCDCIGLVIGSLNRAGETWSGVHGTNYAVRHEMRTFAPFSSASALEVGDLVFKGRPPGDPSWSLPSRYAHDPDQTDYYHVGIVFSVDPIRIKHMTTPSVMTDSKLGKWKYHGKLKKVEGGSEPMPSPEEYEQVTIEGGNVDVPINLRSRPSTSANLIDQIPQGSTAGLIEYQSEWCHVLYKNVAGYVMTKFVTRSDSDPVGEVVSVSRAELERIYDEIGNLLGLRG